MRWTDGSAAAAAYGEDPYGGAGYTYAYGDAYAGGRQYAHGYEYASGPGYAHGHEYPTGQTTTAWDPLYGDADTGLLPPAFDTPGQPVPESDAPESESARPVFVDASGRRQRRVLRAARLLVIPAGGYVALLVSTMLGGPDISSPFVPHADSAHSARPGATAPDPSSGTGHPARSASPTAAQKNAGTAARKAPGPTGRPTASTAPAAPSRPTAAPATTAAPTHRGRALGTSHKPVK
ncbi:hypothetical protein [Streptomyces gilvosporeus]|uniref:Uncharacterized protein n=1 Tax=Streptomyces gilvosporeus TaxID=553510 RepID=A0A1V0TKM6_9ACTN|nr:hypothetical protein [Streptomyces gilvosporeus]ARF53487.1 hypothetical protein B1H19_04275 [Streptomyces gilvosporeus]